MHQSRHRIEPGEVTVGQWLSFYSREFPEGAGRLDYFYDQSRVQESKGHVVSRWKVIGNPVKTISLYVIDISCLDRTFTETGTTIFDAEGHARVLSQSERYTGRQIEAGTSADVFQRAHCR